MRATGMKTSEGTFGADAEGRPSGLAHFGKGRITIFPVARNGGFLHARFNREALPRFGARHAGDGRITPAAAAPPPAPH
jgi:hypothetical protein